ncbi:brix domain-containing protein 2, partial [Metarhizium hybridum]
MEALCRNLYQVWRRGWLPKSQTKEGAESPVALFAGHQRTSSCCSHRHLLNALAALLPHSRRESKFDSKKKLHDLNELADLCNCNNLLFRKARKQQDLYMHISKTPNGPRARFHVQNLHTM